MIRVVSKVVKCKVNDLSTCRITTKTKDIVLRAENLGYFSKRITFSAQTFYGINSIILIRQTGAHGIDNLKLTNQFFHSKIVSPQPWTQFSSEFKNILRKHPCSVFELDIARSLIILKIMFGLTKNLLFWDCSSYFIHVMPRNAVKGCLDIYLESDF